MKLKRICFVTDEYDHPDFHATGGIGTFIKNLSYELRDKGVKVHVFTYRYEMYEIKRDKFIDDNGVIIHSIDRRNRITEILFKILKKFKLSFRKKNLIEAIIFKLSFTIQLYFFSIKNRIDVFEFNDFSGDSCFFLKRNVIIRCHGNAKTLYDHMAYPKYEISIFFEKIAFKVHKRNILCVSNFCKDVTVKSFNLKKEPKVIYNGVNVKKSIRDRIIEKTYSSNKSIYYFGSLRERKGLIIACNIINKVIKKYPNLTFNLIGKNESNNWENICLKILSPEALERTIYHGSMEQSIALDYLEKAHLVIFPSYGENFSISLLEVMALGKIVLTSDIPSFMEVIRDGENGFIAKNEYDYIEKIDYIFNHESINQIAINAFDTVYERFDNRKIVLNNIDYYTSLL